MRRSSAQLLRSVVHGTTRPRPLAVASYKTLTPFSRSSQSPLPPKTFSDSSSARSPPHACSLSYYSLQDNEMEEQWKKISKQYTDGGEEEVIVDPPNLITIESGDDFKTFLSKVKEESLPAVFYYTSLSSAPCRVVLPVVRELSKRNPRITTYKIDKDQEGVKSTLEEFSVTSAPHLNFFLRGKKVGELVGPESKDLMETLQKLCSYYFGMQEVVAQDSGESTGEPVRESNGESVPESTEEDATEANEEVCSGVERRRG